MNKKIIGVVVAVVFLVGCGSQQNDNTVQDTSNTGDTTDQKGITAMYDCSGEKIKATFNNDVEPKTVDLLIVSKNKEMTLPTVMSGSGARYSDGEITFWTHQDQAQLSMEDTGSNLTCTQISDNQ